MGQTSITTQKVPYRIYTDREIDTFLKEDKLSKALMFRIHILLQAQRSPGVRI